MTRTDRELEELLDLILYEAIEGLVALWDGPGGPSDAEIADGAVPAGLSVEERIESYGIPYSDPAVRRALGRYQSRLAHRHKVRDLVDELTRLNEEYFDARNKVFAARADGADVEIEGALFGDAMRMHDIASRIVRIYDEARVEARRAGPLGIDPPATITTFVEGLRDAVQNAAHEFSRFATDTRAEQRARRLEERREARTEAPAAVGGRTCAACGKKPARVDDLCKKCAHDAGILPHGKIGAT